jgi:hypothetical protein
MLSVKVLKLLPSFQVKLNLKNKSSIAYHHDNFVNIFRFRNFNLICIDSIISDITDSNV